MSEMLNTTQTFLLNVNSISIKHFPPASSVPPDKLAASPFSYQLMSDLNLPHQCCCSLQEAGNQTDD